ncbi:MAG: prolyl oligopeptidase family serine peptidase [Bryobacterales bacterium]
MYGNLDLNDPYRTTIHGLFAQPFDFNGVEKTIHVYISAENRQSEPFVLLLVDTDVDVPRFLASSGWQSIADEQGLIVAVAQPPGVDWSGQNDFAYLEAVYEQTHNRSHYNAQKGNNYLAAYGRAATVGQMWAFENPQNFSSFATMGDLRPIPAEFLAKTAAAPTNLPSVTVGEIPMPVWFFVSKMDANAKAVLDAWNKRNDVTDERLSSDLATGVYLARMNVNDSLINEQNFLAQTRYTVTNDPERASPQITRAVWKFLSAVIRPVGFANNALRPSRSVEEWGATIRHLKVGDVRRYWVEYVPEQRFFTNGDKAPLVVYMHGNNNTAESMLQRSDFLKVAKERGFIAILLTGALYNSGTLFPNPKWNLTEADNEFDDYAYVRAAVEDVVSRLPVDTTRIYAMGQSYGSMAMLAMSLRMNDIFAAGAGTGAFLPERMMNLYQSNKVLRGNKMPIQVLLGERDGVVGDRRGGVWENESMRAQMPYWLERDGLPGDVDRALTGKYKSGRFNVYEFANSQGVPLVQYVTVDERIHTIVAMDLYFQYDTFVSKWSRGPDGTLFYMGKAVQ